jgi:hypothetical protein
MLISQSIFIYLKHIHSIDSMRFFYNRVAIGLVMIVSPFFAVAQTSTNGSNANAISTAVPFLTISPDSRSGALGDAGVAISPDANANYWNPSKLAFIESDNDVSLSYSPWLRNLVPDISLSYLSYAHKLDDRNAIGVSLRYFNIGTVALTDANGGSLGTFTPAEFSIDGSFARKFGEDFSLGLTLRYIHSNLSNGSASAPGQGEKAGNAVAADVSMYYKKPTQEFGTDALFAFGADVSNIGTKISYSEDGPTYFLPTNLKVGIANTWYIDNANDVTFAFDVNKLLVPTNAGSDVSVPAGIFQSFSDASLSEEFKEIYYSAGLEYTYDKVLALRGGYYYENPSKGGRNYFTLGVGVKYQEFGFDFAYLASSQANSPLANTLRFTLSANFGATK